MCSLVLTGIVFPLAALGFGIAVDPPAVTGGREVSGLRLPDSANASENVAQRAQVEGIAPALDALTALRAHV